MWVQSFVRCSQGFLDKYWPQICFAKQCMRPTAHKERSKDSQLCTRLTVVWGCHQLDLAARLEGLYKPSKPEMSAGKPTMLAILRQHWDSL